jgi:hydroxyacyl-ACP dehydratase HTD2-like protein with hotdog domain
MEKMVAAFRFRDLCPAFDDQVAGFSQSLFSDFRLLYFLLMIRLPSAFRLSTPPGAVWSG